MTQVREPAAAVATARAARPPGPEAVTELAALPRVTRRIRFSPGIGLQVPDPGTFVLIHQGRSGTPQRVSDWMLELLQRMAADPVPEDELQAGALGHGGPLGLFRWVESVRRLDAAGLIEHSCYLADELLCRLIGVGPGPSLAVEAFDPAARQRVSPLALVTVQTGRGWVAQRPDSHLAVQLGELGVRVLAAAADWTDWTAIEESTGIPGPLVRAVADQLCRASVLDQRPDALPAKESGAPAAVDERDRWSTFDWWLHARSRGPRTTFGWAGSYPGRGRWDPLPPVPPRRAAVTLRLPVPDLTGLRQSGSDSLVEVMERRRSIREHDDAHPITAAQLGELLYRTIRIRQTFPSEDGQTAVDRPVPNGGALHELEVYPIVHRCAGVDSGMWHYRADSHELEWVADADHPGVGALLAGAHAAYTMAATPQVVLVISARFGRVQYKYDAIPYALTLKNTGVLLANLYLVATDMRLAGTAVGSGSQADFAAATGLDQFAEGSVGEFVVGSSTAASQVSERFGEWEQHHGVPLPGDASGA